jgi:hypothetical protein
LGCGDRGEYNKAKIDNKMRKKEEIVDSEMKWNG